MSIALHEATRVRLTEYRDRAHLIAIARASARSVLAMTVLVVVMAGIDLVFQPTHIIAKALAVSAYAVGIGLLCWIWHRLRRKATLRFVSRQIEARVPALRERLLSAVELAEEHESLRYTSETFRAALQQEVAVDMAGVQPKTLLPWQQVWRDLLVACSALILLVTLSSVTGGVFREHAQHAFWPWGNWARSFEYTIEIAAPQPAAGLSPRGDQVQITARVSGPATPAVRLELRHADATNGEIPLHRADDSKNTDNSYSTSFAIRGDWTEYRVSANQDHTPWYRRTSVDRPIEQTFRKQYRFPDYTQLEPLDATENHGDLQALLGTTVALEIGFNVPLSKAAIVLIGNPDATGSTIPLTKRDETHWTTELKMDHPAQFRLELEAADSQLTNVFGRTYTIKPLEDHPPRVEWSEPTVTTVVVTPDTVLALASSIEDELPVASYQQWVRSVQVEWQSLPQAIDVQGEIPQWSCRWNWDLLGSDVLPGTLVRTKLIVIDRKGQKGESPELEVVIARAKLEASLSPRAERRLALADRMQEIAKQAQEREKGQQQARQALDAEPLSDAKLQAFQDTVRASGQQWREAISEVRSQLRELARDDSDVLQNEELRILELGLAQIERKLVSTAIQDVSNEPPADEAQYKQQVAQARAAHGRLEQARDGAKNLSQALRTFSTHNVLTDMSRSALAARDFAHASLEAFRQARADAPPVAAPTNGDPAPRQAYEENFRRQQTQLATHLRAMADQMAAQSERVRKQASNRLRDLAQQVTRDAQRIDKALMQDEDPQAAPNIAQEVLNNLQQLQMIGSADSSLPQESQDLRKQLTERTGLAKDALLQAADAVIQNQPTPNLQAGSEQALNALLSLADRRQNQFAQQDVEASYAADLGDALRGAQDILTRSEAPAPEQAEKLRELAKALHQIETAQKLMDTQRMVEQLAQSERWTDDPTQQRFDHPKSWDSYSGRVERIVAELRAAGFPAPAVQAVDALRWPPEMQQASALIGPRRWDSGPMLSAAEPLEDLAMKIAQAQAELTDTVEKARAVLAEAAPSVSELAGRAAEQAESTATELSQFSQQVAEGNLSDFRAETAAQIAQETEAVSAQTQPLREALADLAARQNLLDTQQRQRARDADTAQVIVDEVSSRLQESFADTARAPRLEDTANELSQAAETSQHSAEVFQQLADHFSRDPSAEQPPAPDSTAAAQPSAREAARPTLEDLLNQLSASEQLADEYQDAERLAQLAGHDPAAMLRALEQELPQNPTMQRELSRIARRTAENSVERLQQLSQQETGLQSELEDSSAAYQHQKALLRRELEAAASRADALARRMQHDLASTVERAEATASHNALQTAQEGLQSALERADQNDRWQTAEGMRQAAEELAMGVRAAEQATRAAEQDLKARADTRVAKDDKALQVERERMENWQREMLEGRRRTAGSFVEQRERQRNQAKQELDEQTNQLNQARSNAENAARQAQQDPTSADNAMREQAAEREAANAERARQLAADRLETAEQRLKQAQTGRDQMNGLQPPPLDRPHPTAQLGQNVASELSEEGAQTASDLERLAGWIPNLQSELAAHRGTLASEYPQQQQVGRDVQAVGRDLDRAAAHEQRLGNSQPGETIAAQAQQVHQIAEGSVQSAASEISNAAGDPDNLSALESEQEATNESSTQAQQALSVASSDLAQQSAALQKQLAQSRGDFAPPAGSTQQLTDTMSSQNSNGAPRSDHSPLNMPPQAMAHLLDQIDRQLREPTSDAATSLDASAANTDPPARMPPQSLSQAARALAARMQQSRQTSPGMAHRTQAAQAANAQAAAVSAQATAAAQQEGGVARPSAALVDPNRVDASGWSKLRQQAAQDSAESTRESVAPGYRQQVDAYFRAVAEQSNQ